MFSVTYELVTEESAEYGEADEQGFVLENASLRDAFEAVFETRTAHCDGATGIEASSYPTTGARWFTVYNGAEFLTDTRESRSLHFPDNITESSRQRILRLAKAW